MLGLADQVRSAAAQVLEKACPALITRADWSRFRPRIGCNRGLQAAVICLQARYLNRLWIFTACS